MHRPLKPEYQHLQGSTYLKDQREEGARVCPLTTNMPYETKVAYRVTESILAKWLEAHVGTNQPGKPLWSITVGRSSLGRHIWNSYQDQTSRPRKTNLAVITGL